MSKTGIFRGLVAAVALVIVGHDPAFALTEPLPVPAPGSLLLYLVGGAALGWWIVRKR